MEGGTSKLQTESQFLPVGATNFEVTDSAAKHVADILSKAILHTKAQAALVVFDRRCELADILLEAYRRCVPDAQFIDFESCTPTDIHAAFGALAPSDLVVLIQSTAFRLDAYRLRVELFKRKLKVIEHVHLARMPGIEAHYYVDSLAYDPAYVRTVGNALKSRIEGAHRAVIECGGEQLVFDSLDSAKLNIGDYSAMHNVGGQFPIGEVFTEAQDLESVNGRVRIFVFGDTTFSVNQPPKPITLVVSRGRVVDCIDSTPEFDAVLANIRFDEGQVWLRELGFGLNRAFSKARQVSDIGTFERMCGIHLSLGAKHGVYNKPNINKKIARHHVDVFADATSVRFDDQMIFSDGAWLI